MDDTLASLITIIIGGGPSSLFALMMLAMFVLYRDRARIIKSSALVDEKIDDVRDEIVVARRDIVRTIQELHLVILK